MAERVLLVGRLVWVWMDFLGTLPPIPHPARLLLQFRVLDGGWRWLQGFLVGVGLTGKRLADIPVVSGRGLVLCL